MFAPGLIVGVDRLGQKDLVQNLKAARVARADAEQDERRSLVAHLDQLDLLLADTEAHQVFHLREEQILRGADGVELFGERHARLPAGEAGLTGGVIRRDVQGLGGVDRREQVVQGRKCEFFHPFAPPLS